MKEEDLKLLAERCRILADSADSSTKRRLQDLALRYEAMCEKPPKGSKVVSLSVNVPPQPVRIQSLKIQLSIAADPCDGRFTKN
jgi:hypothetical protein